MATTTFGDGWRAAMGGVAQSKSSPSTNSTTGGVEMRKKTFELTWRGDMDITDEDVLLAMQEAMADLADEIKVVELDSVSKKKDTDKQRLDELEEVKRQLSQMAGKSQQGGYIADPNKMGGIAGQMHYTPPQWTANTGTTVSSGTATGLDLAGVQWSYLQDPDSWEAKTKIDKSSGWKKWLRTIVPPTIMVIIMLLTVLAFPADGAEIQVETSLDRDVTVGLVNDAQVSNLHLFLDPLPQGITILQTGFEVELNSANSEMIYYSYTKQLPIPSGDIMTLHYPNVVANTTITVNAVGASDVDATTLVSVQGGVGEIKLTFLREDIDNTIAVVIGTSSVGGIDWDSDGDIDTVDIQGLVNNAE